jgi:hypothetical protein
MKSPINFHLNFEKLGWNLVGLLQYRMLFWMLSLEEKCLLVLLLIVLVSPYWKERSWVCLSMDLRWIPPGLDATQSMAMKWKPGRTILTSTAPHKYHIFVALRLYWIRRTKVTAARSKSNQGALTIRRRSPLRLNRPLEDLKPFC